MKRLLPTILVIALLGLLSPASYANAAGSIARDSIDAGLFNNDGVTTVFTLAHTDTGSNLTLVVTLQIMHNFAITSVKYNGVSMTLSSSANTTLPTHYDTYVYTLINPATGTNNIVVTLPGAVGSNHQIMFQGISYTGTNQTAIDSANSTISIPITSPFSMSTTVVAANSWIVGGVGSADGTLSGTPGSGTTYPGSAYGNARIGDSNGPVGTGSQTLNFGISSTGVEYEGSMVSLAPVPTVSSQADFGNWFGF